MAGLVVLRDRAIGAGRLGVGALVHEEPLHALRGIAGLGVALAGQAAPFTQPFLDWAQSVLPQTELRAAITAAVNVGLDFAILHDHHAALDWLLVFGSLGAPKLGVPGSAFATLAANATMSMFVLLFMLPFVLLCGGRPLLGNDVTMQEMIKKADVLIEALPYSLTPSQGRAVAEIAAEIEPAVSGLGDFADNSLRLGRGI